MKMDALSAWLGGRRILGPLWPLGQTQLFAGRREGNGKDAWTRLGGGCVAIVATQLRALRCGCLPAHLKQGSAEARAKKFTPSPARFDSHKHEGEGEERRETKAKGEISPPPAPCISKLLVIGSLLARSPSLRCGGSPRSARRRGGERRRCSCRPQPSTPLRTCPRPAHRRRTTAPPKRSGTPPSAGSNALKPSPPSPPPYLPSPPPLSFFAFVCVVSVHLRGSAVFGVVRTTVSWSFSGSPALTCAV